jgi:epoxyqueuosine reductase
MTIEDIRDEFRTEGFHLPMAARVSAPPLSPGTAIMGLLPIPDPEQAPVAGCGEIAPFAAVHYYRIAAQRLKTIAGRIRRENGLPKRSIRIFSNSPLPERSIAAALGIGRVGRNGLLMNGEYGSSFILAGLIVDSFEGTALPPPVSLDPPADPHAACGACRACAAACPTGAILPAGGLDPGRCLQYLSTFEGDLPPEAEAVWGTRIYGCQICQNVCPVNIRRSFRAEKPAGETAFRALDGLLAAFAREPLLSLKEIFPGTALEAGWIPRDAILRNVLIAAGNSGQAGLRPLLRPFRDHRAGFICRAAGKAEEKLSQQRRESG